MTNINCSSNCIYQKDGKCNFENIFEKQIALHKPANLDCAYFVNKNEQEDSIQH